MVSGCALRIPSRIASPALSVVIPFRGAMEDLADCLRGLSEQGTGIPFEVIVAASGDNAGIEELIAADPKRGLVSSDSRMFPGAARNAGAAHARSDFLAFIDADCVPAADWIAGIYSSLEAGMDVVTGPVENRHPCHPVASTDNLLQFVDFQKYRPSGNLSHFPACNLGIRKTVFAGTGGFPEDMKAGEDVLFSQAVAGRRNGSILFDRRLVVRHKGRKDWGSFLEHHETFGYYRGYHNLRLTSRRATDEACYLSALFFGFRRFIYLIVRTAQWNPAGLIRIILYFPILIAGVLSWVNGFHAGRRERQAQRNEA